MHHAPHPHPHPHPINPTPPHQTNTLNPQVAQDAINDARSICLREYGTSPDVSIYGDPNFAFAYVPSHLHHMVFELVGGFRGGGGRALVWFDAWPANKLHT
jgi:pyruvate dehydrogenase kinase 2/3/4